MGGRGWTHLKLSDKVVNFILNVWPMVEESLVYCTNICTWSKDYFPSKRRKDSHKPVTMPSVAIFLARVERSKFTRLLRMRIFPATKTFGGSS